MSFNYDPKWANAIIYPSRSQCACPYCGEPPRKQHYNEITACLKGHTTYETRHIPPSLTFTCANENCDHCDEDYAINLRVEIGVAK